MRRGAAILLLLAVARVPASAQARPDAAVPAVAGTASRASDPARPRFPSVLPASPPTAADSARSIGAVRAALMSALVPGAGQHALGLGRWVLYVALEAWGWVSYANRERDGRSLERQYKDLAWQVARRVSVGPRHDGSFEYYESMEHYQASGAFDQDPGRDSIQPEADPTTYNGQVWQLSQELYMPPSSSPYATDSPQYRAALAYYESHAVTAEYAWSWGDNLLEQQLYGSTIHQSDQAYRAAKTMAGIIIANHVVSAIDAFVMGRLRGEDNGGIQVGSGMERVGGDTQWAVYVRVPLGGR
jgi:hypothetical protein